MPDINIGTITSESDLTNTIKTYYDRMMLETLDPETKFYQFAVKKPLPAGEGNAVQWNRPRRLGFGQKVTAGIKPSANELSTIRVSSLIETYGGYTVLEDRVSLESITDVLDMATSELAKQAAETIDRAIMHAILFFDDPNTATSAVHMIKASAGLYISTAAFVANTYDNTLIAVSDIRRATAELRRRNAPTVDGQNYIGLIHPLVSEDLRSDATWQNWHQYTTPENLYRGEIGRVEGVRFVETTQTPISAGSGNGFAISAAAAASAMAYGTIVFGRGFYGATELDGGVKTFMVQGATKSDPLNQATTYGWKAHFTAKVLNVSSGLTLWTGSGDDLPATSSTSARESAGLTLSAIGTAS
jgi:N4-gp56 family major capsid protein